MPNKILIADDDSASLFLLGTILKEFGYDVDQAKNGAEVLELAKKNPPSLVISDILMPVMDGFILCRQWKSDERLKQIPFIFYTATYTDSKDEEFALSLGAERFIIKPQEPKELARIVSRVLEDYKKGNLIPSKKPSGQEIDILRQYNEVLSRKLEKKIMDLERTIAERRKAEETIRENNAQLEQRVKDRTAQLEDTNKELESFSYFVSHDLHVPLRAINGFAGILLEDYKDKLDDEGRRLLGSICDNTARMGLLIDDLLAFSRTGHKEIVKSELQMEELAKSSFDELVAQAGERIIHFSIGKLPSAFGDLSLIRQVLTNLIANAIKFTRTKNPAVIEIGCIAKDGENVYYVKDNGVGFDMQYAHKLFGVFQRLHSPKEFEGTGIGLALVQRIIHKHHGRVWAASELNKGTTFYFTLPKG